MLSCWNQLAGNSLLTPVYRPFDTSIPSFRHLLAPAEIMAPAYCHTGTSLLSCWHQSAVPLTPVCCLPYTSLISCWLTPVWFPAGWHQFSVMLAPNYLPDVTSLLALVFRPASTSLLALFYSSASTSQQLFWHQYVDSSLRSCWYQPAGSSLLILVCFPDDISLMVTICWNQ